MNENVSKEIQDHLEQWLQRQKQSAEIVPAVQRAFEDACWQHRALTQLGDAIPEEKKRVLEEQLDLSKRQLKRSLPLPPAYAPTAINSMTTGVTSSTSTVYGVFLVAADKPKYKERARYLMQEYAELQGQHERAAAVSELLSRQFPGLSTQFRLAKDACMVAKSQPDQVPGAASEVRNLLDRFEGELFDKARQVPKENMTWEKMAERLATPAGLPTETQILLDEKHRRARIYARLSKIAKRRDESGSEEIFSLWVLTLDHLYLLCIGTQRVSNREYR
jgi:hypothetical protein